jgi:peroxiredoxin
VLQRAQEGEPDVRHADRSLSEDRRAVSPSLYAAGLLAHLYKSFGDALDKFHDEPKYRLPIPARYVINKQGIIRAAAVNADYTIRPEPSETLRQLRMLTG